MKKTFGKRLKSLRGIRSQADIAAVFGIAQQTYAGWENDKRRPSLTELCGICKHYKVSADWLLGLDIRVPLGDIREDQPLPISPDLSADLVATRNLAARHTSSTSPIARRL